MKKKSSRSYAALYQIVDKLRLVLLLIDDGRCFRRDAYTQHDLSVALRATAAWAAATTLFLLFHAKILCCSGCLEASRPSL